MYFRFILVLVGYNVLTSPLSQHPVKKKGKMKLYRFFIKDEWRDACCFLSSVFSLVKIPQIFKNLAVYIKMILLANVSVKCLIDR